MYYQTKVQFTQEDEKSGKQRKVSELHLVDAISPTEAEAKITKYLTTQGYDDFEVTGAVQSKILSVVN
jgi:hypothetical protein